MDNVNLEDVLSKSSEIIGPVVGAALAAHISGDKLSAIEGAAFGSTLTISLKDLFNRVLSNREQIRVAASTTYIIAGINQRKKQGESFRNDDFFKGQPLRSSAQELFEGVLLKCKDQFQEKKIQFISKIFENTLFDNSISPETANQVLSMGESFTYRKLCIIGLYGNSQLFNVGLLMKDPYRYYPNTKFSVHLEMLTQDIFELVNMGVMHSKMMMAGGRIDVVPHDMSLTSIGALLYSIMYLHNLPLEDMQPIYDELLYKSEYGVNEYGKINQGFG